MTLPVHIYGAITRFDGAAQALAFKGAAHPEDQPVIQQQYDEARQRLIRAIEKAINK